MLVEPNCSKRKCKHYRGVKSDSDESTERVVCVAFPDRIPDEIAYGSEMHVSPYPGDNGVQYEQLPPWRREIPD
jgi:hypothetical protein